MAEVEIAATIALVNGTVTAGTYPLGDINVIQVPHERQIGPLELTHEAVLSPAGACLHPARCRVRLNASQAGLRLQ